MPADGTHESTVPSDCVQRPLQSYDVIYCNVRFSGISVRLRRAVCGVFQFAPYQCWTNTLFIHICNIHAVEIVYLCQLLRVHQPTNREVRSPVGVKDFCSSKLSDCLWGPSNFLSSGCWEDYFTGGKAAEAWSWLLSPSGDEAHLPALGGYKIFKSLAALYQCQWHSWWTQEQSQIKICWLRRRRKCGSNKKNVAKQKLQMKFWNFNITFKTNQYYSI
jgi:hypothetical protein